MEIGLCDRGRGWVMYKGGAHEVMDAFTDLEHLHS